jgi:hypothetical protein
MWVYTALERGFQRGDARAGVSSRRRKCFKELLGRLVTARKKLGKVGLSGSSVKEGAKFVQEVLIEAGIIAAYGAAKEQRKEGREKFPNNEWFDMEYKQAWRW